MCAQKHAGQVLAQYLGPETPAKQHHSQHPATSYVVTVVLCCAALCCAGVRYCVKVTADALSPEASDAITTATLQKVNDMLNTQAALNDLSTGMV